ncbi:MAG: radical SAM protein [Gemmatimonadota bacterium]|nr:MAG: radical SAM protein [Gemmatimonadota bacterium]
MKRLRVGVVDLVAKAPMRSLYARLMHPNLAGLMPQAVAVWAEQLGHDVHYVCYTGFENLLEELPSDTDIVFISAFSQAGQLAYAVSNLFRSRGAVTALGGPHARCYPEDARKYFDYVLGLTDRSTIEAVLRDCAPHRPYGEHLSAARQPARLPGVRERWKFIQPTLAKAPTSVKGVPMIASLGCPYTCSFCIDSTIKYQPLDADEIREDLEFLVRTMPGAWVGWHDPNFGVRFDDYMEAIEAANGDGKLSFVAESSLSLLAEPRLRRLRDAGFKALLPGIESWYTLGNKSKTGAETGLAKVEAVSDHVNTILEYVPYVQTNFVLGLDTDEGPEPFELTKRFIDRTPGAFPGYSLLSAFGEAAPLNLEYQKADRVIPFPFHFQNNSQAMNVRPLNYEWEDFYDHVIDLTQYSFSWRSIGRRARATKRGFATWMNIVRAISSEGFGRIKYYSAVREALGTDPAMRRFFDGETAEVPSFYVDRLRKELGPAWEWLPEGALQHDPKAYLKKVNAGLAEGAKTDPPELPPAAAALG